jgi:hypothetical protein
MIRFRCPFCHQLLGFPDEHAGRLAICPTCRGQTRAPAAGRVPGPKSALEPVHPVEVLEEVGDGILDVEAVEEEGAPVELPPAGGNWRRRRRLDRQLHAFLESFEPPPLPFWQPKRVVGLFFAILGLVCIPLAAMAPAAGLDQTAYYVALSEAWSVSVFGCLLFAIPNFLTGRRIHGVLLMVFGGFFSLGLIVTINNPQAGYELLPFVCAFVMGIPGLLLGAYFFITG